MNGDVSSKVDWCLVWAVNGSVLRAAEEMTEPRVYRRVWDDLLPCRPMVLVALSGHLYPTEAR